MNNVISLSFQGESVQFNLDGWINATRAAARFGKVPNEWLRLASTREYLEKLATRAPASNTGKPRITFVTSRRGNSPDSGTWIHPRLAVKFARWLSVDFEIWVDEQIDALLRGSQSAMDTINRACKNFDDRKARASTAGRELNGWKREKPCLIAEIERGRQLLQMTLGLNDPNTRLLGLTSP
ncbi:KilA-N domain protein [compost metagenome]